MAIPENKMDRDTAMLGAKMTGLETEVRNIRERFEDHEAADDRRHRETIDLLTDLKTRFEAHDTREAVQYTQLRSDIDTFRAKEEAENKAQTEERIAWARKSGIGGMDLGETLRTFGIALAVILPLLLKILNGVTPTEKDFSALEKIEHSVPSAPEPEKP